MASLLLRLLVFIRLQAAISRLGWKVMELNTANFDSFVKENRKVMVDFVDAAGQQNELDGALRQIRDYGCNVPLAKVDAGKDKPLAQRYVTNGRYPQLMWFVHGEATNYHRTLRKAQDITTFALALDRDPVVSITSLDQADDWNRVILAEVQRGSPMFKTLEVVGSRHLDTLAVAHLESNKGVLTYRVDKDPVNTYSGDSTIDAVDRWVRSQLTISEELPEESIAEDGSTVVVGKSFEDIVLRSDKDVFLMVYAPWCGYSRKVFPVWKAFARQVAHLEHLLVAKIDGDRNKSPMPEFVWEAFPTFIFVRAGTATPIVFHGNRTAASFVLFANEHGSKPVSANADEIDESDIEL